MIFPICVLAAGLLLGLAGILLRKKLGRGWMASFLAGGVLLLLCGGWFLRGQLVQSQEKREAVYLSLRYLERYDSGSAAFYLKDAGAAEDYVTAAARYLLERVRGNDLTAQLNLDISRAEARSGEESDFLQVLQVLEVDQQDQLSLAVDKLSSFLNLSQARRETLDFYVEAGDGWSGGDALPAGVDETTAQRLQISSLLHGGAYEQAVASAVALVDQDGSADNRLLLAGAVAESAYNGVILSAGTFALYDGETVREDASVQQEREALEAQCEQLRYELAEIELLSASASDEDAFLELSQQKMELSEEIRQLETRADKLYVYRAFSAIADLHSLEADLVRARLYFALQDYEKAVDTVVQSAGSLTARLSSDQTLTNALEIVRDTYESEEAFYDSQEFRDTMTQLLSAPFSDLVYLSQTALTQDFVERIVSDQKTYGRVLFVSGLDLTDYPVIRVTVSGREELLQQIVEQEAVVRDTREEVSYTAEFQEAALSNVAIVVDRSGSMDGAPMENLKSALRDFAGNMSADTAAALVAFDSSAQLLSDLSRDPSALQAMADTLSANGNTNITSGIETGLEALSAAAGGRVMLLMTDGQSDIDFSVVDAAAEAGVVIHTIGFGSVNDALLQQIADRTGGQYIRADSSSELGNVYASLQQVIGNTVTLTYTVTNEEILTQRYVFLEADGFSVRRDYTLAVSDAASPLLFACSPAVLTPDSLARWVENGQDVTLRFTGENLSAVTAVSVGGEQAEITRQSEDAITVSASPALSGGWQTVTLTLADGTEEHFDRLLIVGESRTCRNLRLGSLVVTSGQGVLPGDGTLVLTGSSMELRENVSENSTLSLYVNGTLSLPWPENAGGAEGALSDLDLGDSGTVTGWGLVTLGRSDGAYSSGAPSVVAQGELSIVCTPEQSELSWQEGGAQ